MKSCNLAWMSLRAAQVPSSSSGSSASSRYRVPKILFDTWFKRLFPDPSVPLAVQGAKAVSERDDELQLLVLHLDKGLSPSILLCARAILLAAPEVEYHQYTERGKGQYTSERRQTIGGHKGLEMRRWTHSLFHDSYPLFLIISRLLTSNKTAAVTHHLRKDFNT